MPFADFARTRRDRRRGGLFAALCTASALAIAAPALGDKYLDQVNAAGKAIQADKRSDLILLPILAAMTETPAACSPALQAALLPADAAAFKDASAWATAAPQAAFIEALAKITGEKDWKKAYGFGLPYDTNGVPPEIIKAKAYTDLGDSPPLLARAKHLYMPMLERAECLVHVEATRLAADGKPDKAIELLWRWVHFARSMADRQFYAEVLWGMKAMTLGLERMRDIAYVDSLSSTPALTPQYLTKELLFDALKDRNGIIGTDRLKFPDGNKIACDQVVESTFKNGAGPDDSVYPKRLGDITAKGRALRLFSEVARWESLSKLAANKLETREKLEFVQNDWNLRWRVPPRDPMLKLPSDYSKLDRVKFAVIQVTIADQSPLFAERHRLEVELKGTRVALAVQGYRLGQKASPGRISSIVPAYIPKLDFDPYSDKDFWYFVPVRDAIKNPIDPITFHEVLVFPGGKFPSFKKRLDESNFVLYSVGPDGAAQACKRATQLVEDDKGDYMIWPPVMSLLREELQRTGAIK